MLTGNRCGYLPYMNRIAALRRERGWSQQDLADRLNTTSVSIGRYEKEDQRLTLPLLRKIAKAMDCSISNLAGEVAVAEHRPVPVYDIRAAAGAGAVNGEGGPINHLMFRESWLHRLATDISQLVVIQVSGDSMWNTLHDGDHALVDRSQVNPRREGLYVIRIDDMLQVKRLSMHPVTKLLTVKSDNPEYPTYDGIVPDDLHLLGRVIWIGRSLG